MTYQFTVQVDSTMMKSAWHAWFFRGQSMWKLFIAALLILISVGYDLSSGTLGSISIVGITILVLAVLLFSAGYLVGLRSSLSKLDSIVDGRCTYTLSDTKIEAESSLGSVSLDWKTITEIRRYHDLILLGFNGAMYSTVPVAQVGEEALSFMIDRCRDSGARIIDI